MLIIFPVLLFWFLEDISEVAVRRHYTKQVFLKLFRNSQESTYAGSLFNKVEKDTSRRLLLILRNFDIQTFNSKKICSRDEYCRHSILDEQRRRFCFYDPKNLKNIYVSRNLIFLMFSGLQFSTAELLLQLRYLLVNELLNNRSHCAWPL